MTLHPVLEEKLNTALALGPAAPITRRDASLPDIPNKAHAVTGMRRAGKTTFLRQLVAERQKASTPERAVYLSFDDDRLADIKADQLSALIEAFYRRLNGADSGAPPEMQARNETSRARASAGSSSNA